MITKYLDYSGLLYFFNKLKAIFGLKETAVFIRETIDNHILNINYENSLAFDTSYIVDKTTTTIAALGQSTLGTMRLGMTL